MAVKLNLNKIPLNILLSISGTFLIFCCFYIIFPFSFGEFFGEFGFILFNFLGITGSIYMLSAVSRFLLKKLVRIETFTVYAWLTNIIGLALLVRLILSPINLD